jgi:hypothetical protein
MTTTDHRQVLHQVGMKAPAQIQQCLLLLGALRQMGIAQAQGVDLVLCEGAP